MTACGIFDFVVDFLVLGPMSSGKTMLVVFFS
jgi:nicotinamide riboside kinase